MIRRSMTFTTAGLLDADGIKTALATTTAAITYSGATLNGAYVTAGVATPAPNGHTDVDQYPVITLSSSAGAYTNGAVVQYVGTYNGEAVTRTATIVGANGGASFIADGPMRTVTSIICPAQASTAGSLTHGFTDLCRPIIDGVKVAFNFLRATGAGNIAVKQVGGYSEVMAFAAAERAEPLNVERIVQATTTVSGFRVAY